MSEKGAQAIDRAFDILELLSLEKEALGVTEIANRISLHKSTAHRILNAMAERGYVEKVPGKSLYRIGLKLIEISSIRLNNIELKTEARPYLWELTMLYNQPAHLAILDGTDAVYIDKVDVMTNIRLYSQIGRRIPVYCSALGKSLISGLSDPELERTASSCKFEKKTEHTLATKEALLEQIRQVRRQGWSVDDEEHDDGIRCIAAPIYDYRGKIIAAVSVAGPSRVFTGETDSETGRIVSGIALNISKRLGYNG